MEPAGKTILIFGGRTGLLGQALTKTFAKAGANVIALSSKDGDVIDQIQVQKLLVEHSPDVVINATAYTQVDLAEDQEELAFTLNATVPPLLAAQAARIGALFIHYSTDFVFRGDKTEPYTENDAPGAMSVYGISKNDGEQGLLKLGYPDTLIIRISWLFGPGKINFVEKILSLAAERDRLTVVNDQTGSPSYAPDVADGTLELIRNDARGLFHLSNSGQTTWHGLASAAVELAGLNCEVAPVPTSAYPTKAIRPKYSVLDLSRYRTATNANPRPWEEALREYVQNELGYNASN
ncbi:dTDP-4-dehydrorhamnose reductase [Pseudodesulfovibrio tunisiensis]|uniref:dTDP-4-dehydrorhamnose reductase n=1 Tax=Pseudodesulfovibrio tunisiensis TaxID=463192 RepID=UPI001FB36931|nr:dTDP-4-dehydrorhamnose reductase [Pseudodesulfovibrio tunisiensis]